MLTTSYWPCLGSMKPRFQTSEIVISSAHPLGESTGRAGLITLVRLVPLQVVEWGAEAACVAGKGLGQEAQHPHFGW